MDANIQVVLTCSLQIINKKIAQTDSHYRQEGDTDAIAPVSGKTRYAEAGRLSQHQARVKREEQNQKRSKERLMESKVVVPAEGQKITLQNGKLNVPHNPIIPFIEGDGIGVDVTQRC